MPEPVPGDVTHPVAPDLAPAAEPLRTAPEPGATRSAPDTAPAPRVAAFFDVDNTIIRGASAFHLAAGLYRRGFFRLRDIARFALINARYQLFGENTEQIDEIRSSALGIMTGHSVAEVVAIGEEVYDQVLELRIFPGTRQLLDEHVAAGHEVWLVTATPVEIGDLIARRLGATGCVGTVAEHRDGFYTGRLVGDLLHGEAKASAVLALAARDGIDLAGSYAYGDSTNDVAILSAVGHPFAINPDARLRRHARAAGWPVREFRGRRRAATRHGLRGASWAGAAWAVGLALRSARRALRG